MSMNYHMMETMAREIQQDRIREAERDSRWAEMRRALREAIQPRVITVQVKEDSVQETELGVAA